MADILFLAHRAPWPPDRGDRIRSWHIVEALAKLGDVHVAAMVDNVADEKAARAKLAPLCKTLLLERRRRVRPVAVAQALLRGEAMSPWLFYSAKIARHVEQLVRDGAISHVVAFSGQMGQYLPDKTRFDGPVLMDFVDVDSAKFATYADQSKRQPMHWVHAREARLLARFECRIATRADASLFISAAEADLFKRQCGADVGCVTVLENGINTDKFDPALDYPAVGQGEGPLAVITGQMDYRPNFEAVRWYARDILPLVRELHPKARFAIVGRSPTEEVLALGDLPGVVVTGEVPDIRPWLAAADVVVAPLILARGIQNKLLEAMAMARPVVASVPAAEGIDAKHGTHLLVADRAKEMAAAVTQLLDDPDRAAAMGRAARQQMLDRYGWAARLAPLGPLLGLGA